VEIFLTSDVVCVGFTNHKMTISKKVAKKYAGIFNWNRDHIRSGKVLKQAGVVHNIKSQ